MEQFTTSLGCHPMATLREEHRGFEAPRREDVLYVGEFRYFSPGWPDGLRCLE